MERLVSWVLQMMLVSGMLTGYYWVVLRNRKLHRYNRGYLLGALLLSLLVPLLPLHWAPFAAVSQPMLGGTVEHVENLSREADHGIPLVTIGCAVGLVVALILLVLSLRHIARVYLMKSRQRVRPMSGFDLIETDDPRAPFSFLNNLFWRRGADPDDPVNKKIFHHELAHIHGRHSWDGLFAQAVCCVFWVNPFFWIIRRELSVVHEFIADAATGMEGDGEGFARMLLQSMNQGRWLEPAQGFFQSPIRRRLVMMSSGRQGEGYSLRKFVSLPVVLIVVAVISCSKAQPVHSVATLDKTDQQKIMQQKIDQDRKQQLFLKLRQSGLGDSADVVKQKLQMEAEFLKTQK